VATEAEILSLGQVRRRGALWSPRSPAACASVGLGVLFVAATCLWLSENRGIPVDDAAVHLSSTIDVYEALGAGHLLKAFTEPAPYPPLTYLVGALGILFGGIGVTAPIVAQNLVFVALLTLGCYKVGRLAFGPLAGVLAVVFALGSPLIIEEFHEFMLDAPEAAMVAVSVWAILATKRFSRLGVSALAGIVVGLGMLSKETFVFFIAGVALTSAVRGGRRAWRGAAVFAAFALLVTLPWYLYELSTVHRLSSEALGSSGQIATPGVAPGIAPPRLSRANLEWYFWNFLNWQLYVPLFAFSAAGWIWTMARFARGRPVSSFAPELAVGAFVAWAALTETYVHDPRYSMPMIIYLAVFGVGWISRLPRRGRLILAAVLAAVALVNTLGVGFGVGERVASGSVDVTYEQQPGAATFSSNHGLWIGAPISSGSMLGLLRALRHDGVRDVRWYSEQEGSIEYSFAGIAVLAQIAGLDIPGTGVESAGAGRDYAVLAHGQPVPGLPRPCIRLRGRIGVWVRRGGAEELRAWSYCPLPRS
jgi:hypothetical protein